MASHRALRLGEQAPDFEATMTESEALGSVQVPSFHALIRDSWAILFSHPADFTPVCTTEFGKLAQLQSEFESRSIKLFGLSCDPIDSHLKWLADINSIYTVKIKFPIIADPDRRVAALYDMLDHQDLTNIDKNCLPYTVRSVFIIDPHQTIRLILQYPTTVGRNFDEILRVCDSLLLSAKYPVSTPANWSVGDSVIINNTLSDEEAAQKFTQQKIEVKTPYLRFTSV